MKTLIVAALLASAITASAQSVTSPSGAILPDWPVQVDGRIVARADLIADGWHYSTQAELDEAASLSSTAAQAASSAAVAAVAGEAAVFRLLYEYHFGPGAVTNHAITEDTVQKYFVARRVGKLLGTVTNDISTDAQDIIALDRGFAAIKGVTGDGTIWTFPWDLVPQLGQ